MISYFVLLKFNNSFKIQTLHYITVDTGRYISWPISFTSKWYAVVGNYAMNDGSPKNLISTITEKRNGSFYVKITEPSRYYYIGIGY